MGAWRDCATCKNFSWAWDLGPDSYAIIEQGRIGQILNSKPMDRRAIIEEAAGITMYKTKRRLAEAKLEASKVNLSRVHDILVEVEKQLASLKRQASKARRYAELREQMRGLLRSVLASKAEHLDIEAARLEKLLREMDTAEEREASSVHELEAEQERLSARTYELDAELRQIQNLLGQTALDLDRAENRITFNREQTAQIECAGLRAGGRGGSGGTPSGRLEHAHGGASRGGDDACASRPAALEALLRETTRTICQRACCGTAAAGSAHGRIAADRRAAGRGIGARAGGIRAGGGGGGAAHGGRRATHGGDARDGNECSALARKSGGGRADVRAGGKQRARNWARGARRASAAGGIAPRAAGNRRSSSK